MHAIMKPTLWRRVFRRHPSAFLLAAQLLSLLLYPLMDQTSEGRMLFGGVAVVVVPLAVWAVNRSPALNIFAWLLAVPSLVLTVWVVVADNMALLPLAASLEALLYFYAAGGLIMYMMRDTNVHADELFAAAATFTLLAWGFAYAYFVCQVWYPGSFTGLEPERERTWLELLFYSVSNLSATGLGDVLPVSPPARVLTMLEQIAGVGYIATVVSRLIGLTIVQKK
ncbi:ion channel [Lysobacter sp. KIS68-7]|uniref:ion channel n=1 Tax=Lysobacter sp. KIS68-7 TaxID=2904252 RepID=UPI001E420969|nr:ion channel [Lysobacter sp. KIS68-7]UHQ20813.1 ion channel [Lysobacter sp. KIS68-7]